MALGAGRNAVIDPVDYTSGMMLNKKVGDKVAAGEPLALAYANKKELLEKYQMRLRSAFKISTNKVEPPPLVYGLVDG
jgi:thymidine phosphorylase